MSDLVRGIHREEAEAAAREAPSAPRPPERAPSAPSVRFPAELVRAPVPTVPRRPAPSPPPEVQPVEVQPVEVPPREEVGSLFAEILAFTGRLPGLARESREFPWEWYQRLVQRAVRSLEAGAELFWLANAPPPSGVEYLAAHLAQVGIMSIRIGAGVGYDRERLRDLGMAALLFDVGLVRLPGDLLGRPEPLSLEDLATYQTHARFTADILRRWDPPRPDLVEAVLQHHERENGQGYPQGLAGSAIHPNAKIIGLLDAYTSLIFPRVPGRTLPPHEAVREIVRAKHGDFPAHLVKALLAEISVFPPRTVVRLNTGEVGRVIAVNRHHPLRPRVEILADSRGSPLPSLKIVDLSETPFIYVTGPVQEGAG